MKELTKKVVEFTRERDWDQFHSPENLAKSISIEAGELLECFQWDNNYDKDVYFTYDKGLSLNDSYWIVENEDEKFEDFNLYDHDFLKVLSMIAYTGYGS